MNYMIFILVLFYFIVRAILETKVWAENKEERKIRYHFYRLIETLIVGIFILLICDNFFHTIGFLAIANLIFESVYNYKIYGYFDRNKYFRFLKWSFYIKYKYHISLALIGIILLILF